MSISEGYFVEIQKLYADVKASFNRLNQLQSALDVRLSDHYHHLERINLEALEGQTFLQEMQRTLKERRLVKDEIVKLLPIYDTLQEQFERMEKRYNGAVKKSYQIRESLNVSGSVADVLAKYPSEIEYR